MVTEVSNKSWAERLKSAFGGIAIGLSCIAIALGVLWWNEGRAVHRAQTLSEGANIVKSIESPLLQTENEGILLHLSGMIEADEMPVDPLTQIAGDGIVLSRVVEMLQWVENKKTTKEKQLGGGEKTITEYTYEKRWEEKAIDSQDFKESSAHVNPAFPFTSQTFYAQDAHLGDFEIGSRVMSMLPQGQPLNLNNPVPEKLADRDVAQINNTLYLGDPQAESIGDVRIQYRSVPEQVVSIVAKQDQGGFSPYTMDKGSLFLVESGKMTVDQMFAAAQSQNKILTWILRMIGLGVLFIGFTLVLSPISVLADVVPLIGSIVGVGVAVISFALAVVTGLGTISIAWFVYRPLIGILLLVPVVCIVIFVTLRAKRA